MRSIIIKKISITKLDTDAIVNAANDRLLAGGGVCGAIFQEAGYEKLAKACDAIGGCKTGQAVITEGFDLPAKYVIHAVGPIWKGGNQNEPKLLYDAYQNSLITAMENGCHSIGFPLISAGIYGYPMKEAWNVAISACKDFMKKHLDYDMQITFAVLDDAIRRAGQEELKIAELFENWQETIIWSCLQGVMGEVHMNSSSDAAMAMLGDFAFYAGNPDEEIIRFKPDNCRQDFLIMVPQNEKWADLIEKCYGRNAKRVTRYATKKEKGIFDKEKLWQAVLQLPGEYEIKNLEADEYRLCCENKWAKDLISQFKDYDTYKNLGIGVVILKDGELVAGASSYSRYEEGIEIEIDTREDYRRKGLAYASGAKLILNCLERGLYPSWDAQNLWSLALAEKLGYHFSHEYTAYEVVGY